MSSPKSSLNLFARLRPMLGKKEPQGNSPAASTGAADLVIVLLIAGATLLGFLNS